MRFLSWLILVALGVSGLRAGEDVLATLRPGHPRLLFTAERLAGLTAEAAADPLRARLQAHVVAAAEAQLKEPMIRYVLVGPRMLDQSRQALAHVTTGAMAFHLTGDGRFADHARDVMLAAAAFPDWNPSHFLDVAEMATALGLGYDWLFDRLTPAERAAIRRALVDKALAYVGPAYARADPERESFPFVKGNLTNNWNQVCNGGFVVAALALAEDEPALARAVLGGLRETLPVAMEAYEPDGAYPEGPVYWGYGTRFNVLILAALESALGTDFGLGDRRGFKRTALFRLHVQSPTGLSFNFADGRATLGADSGLTWLAQRYHVPIAEAESRRHLALQLARGAGAGDRFLATHLAWFPRDLPPPGAPPLAADFDGPSRVALFRTAWGDPGALWTGLKAGRNDVNHGHLDAGSFLLDADGVRWAVDLGPDDYNLPGYWLREKRESPRWQYYRLNNRSHNTLTPDNLLQDPAADATLAAFSPGPGRAFAIADFTSAYPGTARGFRRGLAVLDQARVLVQDEVTALRAGTPLTWRMLTAADVTLDERKATLRHDGRELRVEILAPESARFSTRPARPPTAGEEQNEGVTELIATVPATDRAADIRVALLLTPVGGKWPVHPAPRLEPLEAWK